MESYGQNRALLQPKSALGLLKTSPEKANQLGLCDLVSLAWEIIMLK